jgi:SAM-dependent methyltransferase
MAELGVVQAFDRISPVYDATREPLAASEMDRMAEALRSRGVRSLLEVGVGTGRIAVPLRDRGFEIVGVDASARMLAHARGKGLPRLVRGSAYALPLLDRSVDGAIFVHVLHLLDDPRRALREASRTARSGVTALVRPRREGGPVPPEVREGDPRRMVREILERMGYPRPPRSDRGGPHVREAAVIEAIPPDRLEVIVDTETTEPLTDRLRMIERGASRRFLDVPPETLAKAVEEVRRRVGDQTVTYHRVEALATWERPPPAEGPRPSDDALGPVP